MEESRQVAKMEDLGDADFERTAKILLAEAVSAMHIDIT